MNTRVRVSGPAARLAVAALLFAAGSAWAQDVSVVFAEGAASCRVNGATRGISIGDRLERESVIVLGASGLVGLEAGGVRLMLTRPGSYALRELLASGRASRASAVQSVLKRYLSSVVSPAAVNAAASAGIRGAEQGSESGGEWFEDEAQIHLSAAKAHIAAGEYEAAKGQLTKAMAAGDGDERELQFYYAEAEALGGDALAAIRRMERAKPAGSEDWAPDFALLEARLLLEGFAPRAAVDLLVASSERIERDVLRAPLYYFLLALAYRDLGDAAKSRAMADRLRAVAADGELARSAKDLGL